MLKGKHIIELRFYLLVRTLLSNFKQVSPLQ